jgi:hypothetical protein
MIKNRIASTAALATFGLAAFGGIALAAPGNADAGSGRSSDSSSASSSSGKSDKPSASGSRAGSDSSSTSGINSSGGALTSSNSLADASERMRKYTELKTNIPIYTKEDYPNLTADEIAEKNRESAALLESLSSYAGREPMPELSSSDEYAKKIQDQFSSLIDLQRAWYTKVTQG